jgi:hypothetical protein
MVIENRFRTMQKRETLAQLIRRTVLEFERRQAARLQPESNFEDDLPCIPTQSQVPNNKSKRPNRKNKTA